MKRLENPITVSLEISVIEDVLRIIGSALHPKFCHDEIAMLKQTIISKAQAAIEQAKQMNSEENEED